MEKRGIKIERERGCCKISHNHLGILSTRSKSSMLRLAFEALFSLSVTGTPPQSGFFPRVNSQNKSAKDTQLGVFPKSNLFHLLSQQV